MHTNHSIRCPHCQHQLVCAFCHQPVSQRDLNQHHVKPKSEVGVKTAPAHKRCHIRHHSENGDFARWGRMGGLISAWMRRDSWRCFN